MTELFLKIINMSISASWLILAVLICRLVLKKSPKWINVLLWGIVAMRLLLPFSIRSAWSLIPSAETISSEIMMDATPTIHTGIPAINNVVNPIISGAFAPASEASVNPLQIWIPMIAFTWIVGVAVFLLYTVITYWQLRRKVSTAILFRENIFQSENVRYPFVLGIIRPKIYLPFKMDEKDMDHVIAHELAHIRRSDHLWKPLGFLLLSIYWFNPLIWLAYVLLCRDIELACDEKVIKVLGKEQRADYTQALLSCSANHRIMAACPLAFGEVGVKERVKSVMNYKKPAFWIVALAIVVCIVVAVCFLTNPATRNHDIGKISDAENLVTQHNDIEMVPTTANVQGAFEEYLYVPFGDSIYRYEVSIPNPTHVTIGELVYSFTEEGDPFDVEWNVYEVNESPDHRILYVTAGDNYIQLYCYSPSKRVDSNALQNAKESGYIVMEDGYCTWGAKQWEEFYEMTQNGKSASVKLIDYWTLDPDRCTETYYEVYKEDYPVIYENDLFYDGKTFTVNRKEPNAAFQLQYKYLMKYEDTIQSYQDSETLQTVTRYVLTNDNTVTWDEIIWRITSSRFSSQSGDGIEHYSVYTEIK